MRSIKVEPERLESAASTIEEANREYDRTYQELIVKLRTKSTHKLITWELFRKGGIYGRN